MIPFGLYRSPRNIVFGSGQRAAIGATARSLGTRAFICTDGRMAADAAFRALLGNLAAAGVEARVYDRAEVDVPTALVEDAARAARAFAPDMMIGIGGGSCLDLGKAAGLVATHGGDIRSYYGEFKVPGPVLPFIALPTTSGTGSEVTPVAVLSDPDRTLKVGVSSPHLIPTVAICDPELTLTCPPGLTAVSGADALTHAIEAFTAIQRPGTPDISKNFVFVGKNRLSDYFASLAIRLIFEHLEKAVADGADLAAREGVMLASLTAGMAFGTAGTALAHALQYPVGAATGTSHGAGVAALMPFVMEFNRPAARASYAEIAALIGAGDADEHTADEHTADEDTATSRLIDSVIRLFDAIRIPKSLAELGLAEDRQDWAAQESLSAARLINNNPRKVEFAEARQVVGFAYEGDRAGARAAFGG